MYSVQFASIDEAWGITNVQQNVSKKRSNRYTNSEYQKEYLKKQNQIIVNESPTSNDPSASSYMPSDSLETHNELVITKEILPPETQKDVLTISITNPEIIQMIKKYTPEYQSELIENALLSFLKVKKQTTEFFANPGFNKIVQSSEENIDYVHIAILIILAIAIFDTLGKMTPK